MKILHLPHNIASIPYYTIKGLINKNNNCRSIFTNPSKYHKYPETDTTIIKIDSSSKIKKIASKLQYFKEVKDLVDWADVIHWTFGQNIDFLKIDIDLKIVKKSQKPSLVEWLGSDIRFYELEVKENSYYRKAFNSGYEYSSFEIETLSKARQKKFAKNGFEFAIIRGLEKFVDPKIKKNFYITDLRICLDEFGISIPNPNVDKPLIIHSPSAILAKGTEYVLNVISKLKRRYSFEFVLISGETREKNFEILKKADIYLDQFILGHYGMASLEAMSFGKPVLCYLKQDYYGRELEEIPIVNTTIETLEKNLGILIENPMLRVELGEKSREFVNIKHNANIWAEKLIKIYSELIEKREKTIF